MNLYDSTSSVVICSIRNCIPESCYQVRCAEAIADTCVDSPGIQRNNLLFIIVALAALCTAFVPMSVSRAKSLNSDDTYLSIGPAAEQVSYRVMADSRDDARKRYQWLFRKETGLPGDTIRAKKVLPTLDKEVKKARRQYLSGDVDGAIVTYQGVIDRLEAILDNTPPGHKRLEDIERRFDIFDELTTKILGPVHAKPSSDMSARVFHLFEKRRIALRNLAVKKAAVTSFFDVPQTLLEREVKLLDELAEHGDEQNAKKLSTQLAKIRTILETKYARYARFRKGHITPLAQVQTDILNENEMVLAFSTFRDRTVVGYITSESAEYHQITFGRSELAKSIFNLHDRLREYSLGGRSTFMGHAWKEPCRRLFRRLLGGLPKLPQGKTTIFFIPDGPLWYLPLSVLLNPEDQPFGKGRLISQVSSVDMLRFLRLKGRNDAHKEASCGLVIFESIPWISEKDMQKIPQAGRVPKDSSSGVRPGEEIIRMILSNPVYPRPSDYVKDIQKKDKGAHAWAGPTATLERLLQYEGRLADEILIAVPLAMPDMIKPGRQPVLFMAPKDSEERAFPIRDLFNLNLRANIAVFPLGWLDIDGYENNKGEGPLLFNTALAYSGISSALTNYSNPAWGEEEPFLTKVIAYREGSGSVSETIRSYPRELHRGLDTSFGGMPPAWAGWILSGDPPD